MATWFYRGMAASILYLTLGFSVFAQSQSNSVSDKDEIPPSSFNVGAFQFGPAKAVIRAVHINDSNCLFTVVRFAIKNISSGDIRLALLGSSLGATDDLGADLLRNPLYYGNEYKVQGLYVVSGARTDWTKNITDNASSFSTLSPQQTLEVLIQNENQSSECIQDKNKDYLDSHKPQGVTLTGELATIDLKGKNERRSFQYVDLPVRLTR